MNLAGTDVLQRALTSRNGAPALVPYVMAGDPDLETAESVVRALSEAGAGAIELGVPYGDPLADGPIIARAAVRALRSGTTLSRVLESVERVSGRSVPIVLFTYFNLVDRYGIDAFARDAASAGATGVIVPDITIEESAPLRQALASTGLAMPMLVAPTTRNERARRICAASTGFIYVVSRLGVTGSGTAPSLEPLCEHLQQLRALTGLPLAAGFGLSRREHVDALRGVADAAIVGSALVDALASVDAKDAPRRAGEFLRALQG